MLSTLMIILKPNKSILFEKRLAKTGSTFKRGRKIGVRVFHKILLIHKISYV